MIIDLKKPDHSYFYGFALADGHLREYTRNRGSLSIEISERDSSLLHQFKNLFDINTYIKTRTRDTNFITNYTSVSFSCYDWNFRKELKTIGFPAGKKDKKVCIPLYPYRERDFWRGMIDGDGSLGITSQGYPFLSFTTKSDNIANNYKDLVLKICGYKPQTSRNKRDDIYNICLCRESSQRMTDYLYYNNCLALKRKYDKKEEILCWINPRKKKISKYLTSRWQYDEIDIITKMPIEESLKKVNRSRDAIEQKLKKLQRNHLCS